MINNLMYIELKTGYSDDGPAWIGYVKTSKTKKQKRTKNTGSYMLKKDTMTIRIRLLYFITS